MTQKIKCSKGKCWDLEKKPMEIFDEVFKSNPMVHEIERDLWKKEYN